MTFKSLAAAAIIAAASFNSFAAGQPHMQDALAALEQAKDALNKASADKGGHRVKALKAVDQAIEQVKAGIEYDKTHTSADEAKKGK